VLWVEQAFHHVSVGYEAGLAVRLLYGRYLFTMHRFMREIPCGTRKLDKQQVCR
jgi:hypothetical protein